MSNRMYYINPKNNWEDRHEYRCHACYLQDIPWSYGLELKVRKQSYDMEDIILTKFELLKVMWWVLHHKLYKATLLFSRDLIVNIFKKHIVYTVC